MKHLTETYRIKLSPADKHKLNQLRKYNIIPTKFIRIAIQEKLERDIPKLTYKQPNNDCPF